MPQVNFYSDASRGATIKALQQRRAAIEQANQQALAQPLQITAPSQGYAALANTAVGSFREIAAAHQEKAARQRFAELMAGGLSPDEMGEAIGLDPETTMKYQEHTWDTEKADREATARRDELVQKHGWDVTAATERVKADQALAKQQQEAAAGLETQREGAASALETQRTGAASALETQRAGAASELEKQKAAEPQPDSALDIKQRADRGEFGDLSVPENKAIYDAAIQKATYVAPGSLANQFSPYEQKRDQEFATSRGKYESEGRAGIASQTANIQKALQLLGSGEQISGTYWQQFLNAVPDEIKGVEIKGFRNMIANMGNPEGNVARDAIKSAVQESLTSTLGSQFAEREGQQMMERAFDPNQPPKENARRAGLLLQRVLAIGNDMERKIKYMDDPTNTLHSLRGYTDPEGEKAKEDLRKMIDTLASGEAGGAANTP